ncbi:hypothetical protein ACF0H5_018115 [Mactra antiquata]
MFDLKWTCILFVLLGVCCVNGECPETFERHGTQCYKVFSARVSWLDAIRYCRLRGSQLLSIQSLTEQTVVNGILQRIRGALESGSFWIGGGDMFNEGVFSWYYENGQFEPISGYTNWESNQPDNRNDVEHCLGIDLNGRNGEWNDRDCNEQRYPICEARSN